MAPARILSKGLLFFLLCAPASAQFDFPLDFQAPRGYSFGGLARVAPQGLALVDLNEDGVPDLLAPGGYRLSTGPGRYRLPVSNGHFGTHVTAGDLNGDDHLDFVVADEADIHAHLGDGTGTFTSSQLFFPGVLSRRVAIADLDEDGQPDILVLRGHADADADRLTVLYGDGAGAVESAFAFPTPEGSREMEVTDLDEDGHLDVLTLQDHEIAVFWGSAQRVLNSPETIPFSDGPSGDFGLADITGDGRNDIVVSLPSSDKVLVLIGTGTRSPGATSGTPVAGSPDRLALGDLDKDGRFDVVVRGSSVFKALLGRPNGTLRDVGSFGPLVDPVASLEVRDFDGDGVLDVVALMNGNDVASQAVIFHGQGGGRFENRENTPLIEPDSVAVADFDEDGHLDAAIGHSDSVRVSLLLGDGKGGLTFEEEIETGLDPDKTKVFLATGDFNADGRADLAVGRRSSSEISILIGDLGTGFTQQEIFVVEPSGSDFTLTGLTATDFEGDGDEDLLVGVFCYSCGPIRGFERGYLTAHRSNLAGFVQTDTEVVLNIDEGDVPAAGDLNGDGRADALYGDSPVLFWGREFGRFDPGPSISSLGSQPAIGDVNNDGHNDIVSNRGTRLRIHLGNGLGGFIFHAEIRTIDWSTVPRLVDLDQDGNLDIVVIVGDVSEGRGSILPLRGDGTGSFTWEPLLTVSYSVGLGTGDFDEDGQTDLVAARDERLAIPPPIDRIAVIRNQSLDHLLARQGNVNAAAGPVTDVLFVNDSTGSPLQRKVIVDRNDPIEIRMDQPPSRAMSQGTRYTLYAHCGEPTPATTEFAPFDLGTTCLVTPLNGGSPKVVWNTFGRPALGIPDFPADDAPTVVATIGLGIGVPGTFTLQGYVADPAAPNGLAAVTNAVIIESQ